MDWMAGVPQLALIGPRVFFPKSNDEEAVQYFYEPFLEAFDPERQGTRGLVHAAGGRQIYGRPR